MVTGAWGPVLLRNCSSCDFIVSTSSELGTGHRDTVRNRAHTHTHIPSLLLHLQVSRVLEQVLNPLLVLLMFLQ